MRDLLFCMYDNLCVMPAVLCTACDMYDLLKCVLPIPIVNKLGLSRSSNLLFCLAFYT